MMLYTKRVISAVLIMVIAMSLVLALPLTALGGEGAAYEGTYEGECDANGKRSGYGTWMYHNFLYEGNWENDMPNGQGTLYESNSGKDFIPSIPFVRVIQATWTDGFANGPILLSEHADNGEVSICVFDVEHGRIKTDIEVDMFIRNGEEIRTGGAMCFFTFETLGGVPTWANAEIDKSATPPTPSDLSLPSWTDAAGLAAGAATETEPLGAIVDDGEGLYGGEYDANGKRSGYGTWTYHNFVYEGQWEYDMPNGKGTLYESRSGDSVGNPPYVIAIQGTWTNGLTNGPVLVSEHEDGGDTQFYALDVKRGRSAREMRVDIMTREDGETALGGTRLVTTYWNYGAVPPWANNDIDPSANPPVASALNLPSRTEAEGMIATLLAGEHSESALIARDNEGIYEGERDKDGKRSGYGTWAYHNFLYVGNWENDRPRGEGTLYLCEEVFQNDKTGEVQGWQGRIAHGDWYNGVASGSVEYGDIRYDYTTGEGLPMIYRKNRQPMPLNVRGAFFGSYFDGLIPPDEFFVNPEVPTPWFMHEIYPTGIEYMPLAMIENTGMGITPGNLANGSAMAALGDWLFMRVVTSAGWLDGGDVTTIYKMRTDGTQVTKLHEHMMLSIADGPTSSHAISPAWLPSLQVIGDWLYVGEEWPEKGKDYKTRADDAELTPEDGGYPSDLVVDDWVYQVDSRGSIGGSVYRYRLDNSELTILGDYEPTEVKNKTPIISTYMNDNDRAIFADKDWVYVYRRGFYIDGDGPHGVDDMVKVRNNGTGVMEFFPLLRNDQNASSFPQIVGGRIYYVEDFLVLDVSVLYSVDLDFAQAPVTVVSTSKDRDISTSHVTDDYIYYCDVPRTPGRGKTSYIIRVNHDGSDPVVLAKGFEGSIGSIHIAGDWMMFQQVFGKSKPSETYLMRLDGRDLHRLEDSYGIMDSTGKWRYELLEDGSAEILGAGSKLKLTGKLAIPSEVDKIPVTAIGNGAFMGCEGFTGVTVPNGVTTIGDNAFFFCQGLTGLTIPEGVTRIGEGAFQWCSKLKKVSLPASLASVGKQAFANCPTVKLSMAKGNETFEIVDGVVYDKVQNKPVE